MAALSIALAGCGGDSSQEEAGADPTPAQPTRAEPSEVSGGEATLRLGGSVTTLLGFAGVEVVAVAPATRAQDDVTLPIAGGTVGVDPLAGRLAHEGGIRFEGGGGSVEATDLRLDLGRGIATADVEGERLPLMNTRFDPARLSEDRRSVVIESTDVTVADEALPALNAAIGSDVVPRGLGVGELTIRARWP